MSRLVSGTKAPAFSLIDQSGSKVKLADFKGRRLLLYFYPKADTPGCTKQSCSVRDARPDFEGLGVDVVGISPDKPEAQRKFDEKYNLGFPLLSDPDHKVAESYGVWDKKSLYGKVSLGIIRSAFLIDEKGKLVEAWYKISPQDTVPKAMSALAAHQA